MVYCVLVVGCRLEHMRRNNLQKWEKPVVYGNGGASFLWHTQQIQGCYLTTRGKKTKQKKNIFLGATITVLAAVNVIIALPLDSNEE